MWRLSAMARVPKSSSGAKAGMRRCFRDRRPLSMASNNNNSQSDSQSQHRASSSLLLSEQRFQCRRSRYLHTTAPLFKYHDDEEDMMNPEDPDDIPDFVLDDLDTSANALLQDEEEREQYRLQQEKVNDELDNRQGRPWKDPWEIKEEQWMASDTSSESLPDWNPSFVSRISLERLQVLPNEDGKGIPTLQEICEFSLPASDPELHPSRKTKTYAAYRKSQHYAQVRDCVATLAKDRVEALLNVAAQGNPTPEDQQDAVDALFEDLQEEAKADASMDILSKHPAFPSWVDRGLEDYLRQAEREALEQTRDKTEEEKTLGDTATDVAKAPNSSWKEATPVFMDCYDPSEASADGKTTGPMVPKILTPLGPHRHGGPGRMVEEWELSAHATTKRIMLRECTQKVAGLLLQENASKIYVHGRQGVGKSALLASIVAAARTQGHIVLYLPDGDRLRKNGFFITPSTHPDRTGMFDLQDLSQEVLQQLVESHDAATQMEGMVADRATLELYFKDTQFKKLDAFLEENGKETSDGGVSLLDLIEYSQEYKKHAPMGYSVVVNRLMNQTEKKFMIVMDEFNCLYDKGHYYHMAYDEDVREAIPYDQISLFEPIMHAMGLSTQTLEEEEDATDESLASTFPATTTAVVVGTSESHAVAKGVTSKLTDCALRRESVECIEVPRFSSLEADHILANFEATGVGKLRLDRGDTVMNPQEMEYLKMASGSIGQKLLDVSIF